MKVVTYQGTAQAADKASNLATIDQTCAAGALLGGDVVVFPELFLTGYNLKQQLLELAEPLNGASIEALKASARRHGIALICGFPERVGTQVFNSAVAIDHEGKIKHCHHKVHLFGDEEKALFTAGEHFEAFTLAGESCALSICYDIEFPETGREVARQGARVLFNPTANMDPFVEIPVTLARARALESGLAVVYANLSGQEGTLTYTGLSAIIAPDGTDLARAGRDQALLMADIAPALERDRQSPMSTQLSDLDN